MGWGLFWGLEWGDSDLGSLLRLLCMYFFTIWSTMLCWVSKLDDYKDGSSTEISKDYSLSTDRSSCVWVPFPSRVSMSCSLKISMSYSLRASMSYYLRISSSMTCS